MQLFSSPSFPLFPQICKHLDFIISSYISCCDQKQFNVVLVFIQKDIWGHFDILDNIFLWFHFPVVYHLEAVNSNLNEKNEKKKYPKTPHIYRL